MLSALVLTGLLQTSAPGEFAFAPATAANLVPAGGLEDELRPFPAKALGLGRGKVRLPELRDPFENPSGPVPAPGDGVELQPFPAGYLAARTRPLNLPELRDPFAQPRATRVLPANRNVQLDELRNPFAR